MVLNQHSAGLPHKHVSIKTRSWQLACYGLYQLSKSAIRVYTCVVALLYLYRLCAIRNNIVLTTKIPSFMVVDKRRKKKRMYVVSPVEAVQKTFSHYGAPVDRAAAHGNRIGRSLLL